MIHHHRIIISFAIALLCLTVLPSATTHAAECANVTTSIINCANNDNGVWQILIIVLQIMAGGVVIAAIGGFVYAGILYASAEDKSDKVSKAKQTIFNVILGLVAFAFMYSLLQFIIPGGVFNRAFSTPSAPPPPSVNDLIKNNGASSSGKQNASANTKGTCYTVTSLSGKKIEGNMYHKSGNQTYAFENSTRGVRYAADNNYTSIDLDIQVTKDKVPVATHWSRPMNKEDFYDPLNKLKEDTKVNEMTLAQITRLEHRDGKSKIVPLDTLIALAAEKKINLSIEIKAPVSIRSHLDDIAASLNKFKVKAYIKGNVDTYSEMNDTLEQARNLGFWTRGTEGTQAWMQPTPKNCS